MRKFILYITTFMCLSLYGKNDSIGTANYLEDQFYVGFNYILLKNVSEGIKEKGFSNSLSLGFIKDMPLNERRSFALGLGVGYGRNTYYQNIKINKINGISTFTLLEDGVNYSTNKFSLHAIEVPLEIRWRSSTREKYKFWRVYAGTKLSYAFVTNSKLKDDDGKLKIRGIDAINKFQQGLTLSVGYGTWNFSFYYGISDLFKDAYLENGTLIKMNDYRIGLIFYIL